MNKIRYIVTDEILEEQLLPNKASYTESYDCFTNIV